MGEARHYEPQEVVVPILSRCGHAWPKPMLCCAEGIIINHSGYDQR